MEFEDTRDADDAVYELNGKELCGERVLVEHARGPRRDRDRDGYGGGYWGSGRSKFKPQIFSLHCKKRKKHLFLGCDGACRICPSSPRTFRTACLGSQK